MSEHHTRMVRVWEAAFVGFVAKCPKLSRREWYAETANRRCRARSKWHAGWQCEQAGTGDRRACD
jgi:hypothetical protein